MFPALDIPKPLQAICGVFPLPQLREPYSAVQYVAERVPLETVYSLTAVTADVVPGGLLEVGLGYCVCMSTRKRTYDEKTHTR